MTPLTRNITALLICTAFVLPTQAGELKESYYLAQTDSSFNDVMSDLNDAVVNRGLVVDFVGHVGDMLSRTANAANSKSPYVNAKYLQFCSSKLTHAAVAANVENMAICPYVLFAYEVTETPGKVMVGYRRPSGASDPASKVAIKNIEDLLRSIVDESAQ